MPGRRRNLWINMTNIPGAFMSFKINLFGKDFYRDKSLKIEIPGKIVNK